MSAAPKLPSLPVDRLLKGARTIASGVPEGLDALLLGELARHAGAAVLHVARDGNRLATLADAIAFFAPDVTVLSFPAWDSVPYDRVAPNAETIASRIATLSALTERGPDDKTPLVLLTSVNAVLQRVPPPAFIAGSSLKLQSGSVMSMHRLIERLEASGYGRAGTVTDPGQYAVRGGILDLFPPGGQPVRLDFFGDTLESMRAFDPETQRTEARLDALNFLPMSEVALTPDIRSAFRQRYVELFGAVKGDDPLYEAISAGHQHQGMEHWLHALMLMAGGDRLVERVVAFDRSEQLHITLAEGAADVGGQRHLAHRQEIQGIKPRLGPLGFRIEGAHGFQRVAEEVEAHRLAAGRKKIEDATAHGVLARVRHRAGAAIARGLEALDEPVHAHDTAGLEFQAGAGDERRRRHALQHGVDGGQQHQRCLVVGPALGEG